MIEQHKAQHRHAVILCHPAPQSFNRLIAEAYCKEVQACGHDFILRDLYAMKFDPVLRAEERQTLEDPVLSPDVEQELAILRTCDAFVLVYPIWFGTPPAMLKGYIERVLGWGTTPDHLPKDDKKAGFLAGKRLISFTSSATRDVWLDEVGQVEGMRQVFDRYLARAFGMKLERYCHFGHIVPGMRDRWIQQYVFETRQQAHALCAEMLRDPLPTRVEAQPSAPASV